MEFFKLLRAEDIGRVIGRLDRDVCGIGCDSRLVNAKSIFFCLRGAFCDGHSYAGEAYRRGCRHFVAERRLSLPSDVTLLLADNAERRMALMASDFYGSPASKMTVIGITGTKGKTTTARMLMRFLETAGEKCAYIGSSGVFINGIREDLENTTPQSPILYRYIAAARDAGVKNMILEISSQALARGRVHGLPISIGVFTNLSRDHIGTGEHGDMREYADAKLSMFTGHGVQTAVLNGEDAFSDVILHRADLRRGILCGNVARAQYYFRDICPIRAYGKFGTHAVLTCRGREYGVMLPFAGRHYVSNLIEALATAEALTDVGTERLLSCVPSLSVPGRCEVIHMKNGATFVIDYAHNGASLRAALLGLRPYTTGRLLCLFGAVGDRAQCRRSDMASAACELADFFVITEDNSGGECPEKIIGEIYRALPDRSRAVCIPNREEAIAYLCRISVAGDVVLLAGKGDERYQISGGGRLPFCEKDLLLKYADSAREK